VAELSSPTSDISGRFSPALVLLLPSLLATSFDWGETETTNGDFSTNGSDPRTSDEFILSHTSSVATNRAM
jgi:hypothetical protein